MATKKASASASKNTALAVAGAPDPLAALKAKIAALPQAAQALILKDASGTKLTRAEIGTLRTFKLKKNGDPIVRKPSSGPRVKAAIDDRTVTNVIDIAGVDGLTKLHTKFGDGLHKPLAKAIKAMADGADKTALLQLSKAWFPRKSGAGGFASRGYQVVGKVGRVAFEVTKTLNAHEGDQLKNEIMTAPDGRVGLFVYVSAKASDAAPVAPSAPVAAPAAPPFAMTAPSA